MRAALFLCLGVVLSLAFIVREYLKPYFDDSLKEEFADFNVITDRASVPFEGARVTFLGVSTLLIDDGVTQLMVDGFLTRPSFTDVFFSKIETDQKLVNSILVNLKINRLKAIFVTHSHYDHALDAVYIAKKTGAQLHGSPSTYNLGLGGDIERQLHLFAASEKLVFGDFVVEIFPSVHSEPGISLFDDRDKPIKSALSQPLWFAKYSEGGSYDVRISHPTGSIFVKPSANIGSADFDPGSIDLMFFGTTRLGSYDPEFRDDIYEQIVARIKPRIVIPVHWDNFLLPLSPNLQPLNAHDFRAAFDFLSKRLRSDGIEFRILDGYQRITLLHEE